MFQPEPLKAQSTRVVPYIEMQYDYYTPPPQTYQEPPQTQTPLSLPIYQVKTDYIPIIAIVSIVGLLGLFAFLAYMKR